MSDYLTLRMRCVICCFEFDHEVQINPEHQHRVRSQMATCPVCASWTAEPTTRPYRLGLNDQRLLRSMRIKIEAEDVGAPA